MKILAIRNALGGLMLVGLLGSAASCNRSERSYDTPRTATDPTNPPIPTTRTPSPGVPTDDPLKAPPAPVEAEPPKRDDLSAQEMDEAKRLLTEIRKINALEIAVGKLAQERGANDEVKEFGKKLVEDHQTSDSKVVELAGKYKVALTATVSMPRRAPPTTAAETGADLAPPSVALDAEAKKTLSKQRALRGARFDRGFVSTMVEGHEKALNLIKTGRDKIDNEDFKNVLGEIQSSVESHLEHAKKLQSDQGARAAAPAAQPTREGRRPPPVRSPVR